ncbi:MAG: relaxase/mobilization nuclease domain-containing protein [Pseudomonadota bacterium]
MLIKFFKTGQGGGAGPVDYLIEREVVAYDSNRKQLRDDDGNVLFSERKTMPEVLRGDPDQMRLLIDSCRHQWAYRAGVLSFTVEDAPTPDQQNHAMDEFEKMAFAGLDPEQRSILWVRHTHEDRVELHFVTTRMELVSGKSLNIAPPGYQKSYDALRDVLNKQHGWADPDAPERARDAKYSLEGVQRAQSREQIHEWVFNRIEAGQITDRASMFTALSDVGFEIPRAGKNYITVHDPENDERWRLKGEVFNEAWTREATIERAFEQPDVERSRSGSRLDKISLEELRERLRDVTEKRAAYHRKRYPNTRESFREIGKQITSIPSNDIAASTYGYFSQLGSELVLGKYDHREDSTGQLLATRPCDTSNGTGDSYQLGSSQAEIDRLPYWQRTRKLFANFGKGLIHEGARYISYTTRERIDAIRGTIDTSIRRISETIQRNKPRFEASIDRSDEIIREVTNLRDQVANLSNDRFGRIGKQLGEEYTERAEPMSENDRAGNRDTQNKDLNNQTLRRRRSRDSDHSL